jgi:hypothetical protein
MPKHKKDQKYKKEDIEQLIQELLSEKCKFVGKILDDPENIDTYIKKLDFLSQMQGAAGRQMGAVVDHDVGVLHQVVLQMERRICHCKDCVYCCYGHNNLCHLRVFQKQGILYYQCY